jgi:beta-mannanase
MRRVATLLGCTPSVVSMFVKLDSAFTAATLVSLSPQGETPFITLEPWPQTLRTGDVDQPSLTLASVAGGSHDAALTRIARVIAAYHTPVYLRYAHEMNGEWYPWAARVNGGSPSAYVAAWKHVHNLFVEAGARNARWVWSPSALPDGPTGSGGGLAALYPVDAYVDYVGFTGYGHRVHSAQESFGPWLAVVAKFTDRPVVLSEIGADGAYKTAWIESLAPYIEHTASIAGFIWFNTSPKTTGATGYYRIDDSPSQVSAFRAVLARLSIPCVPTQR